MKTYNDISLKPYNTFGIDVKARRLVELGPADEVPAVEAPYLVIGAGSDMVFTKDYGGTVVRLADVADVAEADGGLVTAWGGMTMDRLVEWTLERGLYGLENLSAIPGTVGAAVVQNVGAYGVEAKDVVERVETVSLADGQRRTYTNADCRFGYRTSRFKQGAGNELIVRVTFRLRREFVPNLTYKALEGVPHDTAWQLRQAITDMRWAKLPRPEENGSAGSFFKNPVVDEEAYNRLKSEHPDMPDAHPTSDRECKLSAGWLIDKAGWKGKTMGGAGVWPKQALVLYNAGGCTGGEVVALADAIVDDVRRRFGITLVPEAIII